MKSWIVSLLALIITASVYAQDYGIAIAKDWNGPTEFRAKVVRLADNHWEDAKTFHALSLERFKLVFPSSFPVLDPKNPQSCSTFMNRVTQYVEGIKFRDYSFIYEAKRADGTALRPLVKSKSQEPLSGTIAEIGFKIDHENCGLSISRLRVVVTIGPDAFVVDITHKLPEWISLPFEFCELNSQGKAAICANSEGEVFSAAGHRRECTIPVIDNVNGFQVQRKEASSFYVPTTESHEKAIFASVFPARVEHLAYAEVCALEPAGDDDDDYSMNSSSQSMVDGDDDGVSSSTNTNYTFYEITGAPELIPAEKNPFLFFDKSDRKTYYTKAYQAQCYPVDGDTLDRSNPHILQYFVKTKISAGTHYSSNDGFGLRWTILDEEGLPIDARACTVQPLSWDNLKKNLNTRQIMPGQKAQEEYKFQADFADAADFPAVYDGNLNDNHASLFFDYSFVNQPMMHEQLRLHTLAITALTLKGNLTSQAEITYPSKFDMTQFPKITKLYLDMGRVTSHSSISSHVPYPFGNVKDVTIVYNDPSWFSLPSGSRVQWHGISFRSLSLIVKNGAPEGYRFLTGLTEYLKNNRNLETLYLDIQFPDHPYVNTTSGLYDDYIFNYSANRIEAQFPGLGYYMTEQPWTYENDIYTIAEKAFGPALCASTVKQLIFVKHRAPRGRTIRYMNKTLRPVASDRSNGYQYQFGPRDVHYEWEALMKLFDKLQKEKPGMVVIKDPQ